jgi:glycosyltransferase involved in cell wall biosynthesis
MKIKMKNTNESGESGIRKVFCVIPALNEAETIGEVIAGVKEVADQVIVVNDHSIDTTKKVAEKAGALVVDNETNLGYDKSINKGFARAIEDGASIIFTFDADGQHNSDDARHLVELLEKENAAVAVGIRPSKPRISEHLFAKYTKRKAGISDPLCGLKVYRSEVFTKRGYFDTLQSIGTQLSFETAQDGGKIVQAPITITDRADTPRFGRKLKANIKILAAFFRILRAKGL